MDRPMVETAGPQRASDAERPPPPPATGWSGTADRVLGSPWAFVATALVLLSIFAATFVTNPGRVAPGDDPAFYTWRTELLLSERPGALLEITGPRNILAGGYRVATPVIGGLLRQVGDVAPTTMTILMTVGLRTLLALLLAGWAFRHRRDPLVFHGVAFGSASLLLVPPFFGYLDNLLCLFFLTASLYFLEPARTSWTARFGFGGLLLLAGLSHPTTLVIFGGVLGAMAGLRLLTHRFDFRAVLRDDGPVLASAAAAAVATYVVWQMGAWGPSAPLSDAALPPPAGQDFFMGRLTDWFQKLRPFLNGPLFLLGLAMVLTGWRRIGDDDFARSSVAWLLPLVGIFGFILGLAYPYYRFFNTTPAWILLVGLGIAVAARFFIESARRSSPLALIGLVALVVIVVTNFGAGMVRWTKPSEAWLSSQEITDFEALRNALEIEGEGRPVIFVGDTEATEAVRIYGYAKFSANVSRHGLPHGYLDRGYFYLGTLDDAVAGRPSTGPNLDYDDLSWDFHREIAGEAASGGDPIYVVAQEFNHVGRNAGLASREETTSHADVWILGGSEVTEAATGRSITLVATPASDEAGATDTLASLLFLTLLMIPGFLWFRALVPDGGVAEGLGLVPALSVGLLALIGFVVLAVARSPFSTALAWLTVALALALAAGVWFTREGPEEPAP